LKKKLGKILAENRNHDFYRKDLQLNVKNRLASTKIKKSLPEHIPATQRVEKFIYAFARLQILKNLPIDSKTSKK